MQFDDLVKDLLLEWPYIEVNNQMFDLEIEKYKKNRVGFIKFINSILRGNEVTDRYGNTLCLKTPEDKEAFKTALKKEPYVTLILSGSFER